MLLPIPAILLIMLILSKNLPATIRANVFRAFISFLLSGFVLDRIYRIDRIKNVADVFHDIDLITCGPLFPIRAPFHASSDES